MLGFFAALRMTSTLLRSLESAFPIAGSALWGWDADGVGAAGTDGAAACRLKGLAEADFDRGEVVAAATEGEAGGGNGGIGFGKEAQDLCRGHGDLVVERG